MGHSAHFCRRRCKFCKQVHEVGQCELFRRYEKLASFVKNNVENPGRTPRSLHAKRFKLGGPPTLTELEFSGQPQSAEPVVKANFVFAFGKQDGPRDRLGRTKECVIANERESEESDEDDSAMVSAAATRRYDGVTPRTRVVKLFRGERLGWWSSQKFDRRVRMRALVMGAVNDKRVKILLDTGANVSAASSTLARQLRLKQYASRDQQIDIEGIGKDKVSTTHKALVKVTLGWEVVYEFETADGPTEAVCLSDRATAEFKLRRKQPIHGHRATAEFKLRRKQPSELTNELWARRTDDWIPTIVMNAKGKATR
ncbi:LOW QUALITY PROTEIN: Hypothetical protein PHPALM_16395, partial [Phytophthora palmivora]